MSEQMQMFPLTPEEAQERAKRLAAKVQEYKRVEDEKKTAMREFTSTLKDLRGEMEGLADVVINGKEWRDLLGGHDDDAPYRDR